MSCHGDCNQGRSCTCYRVNFDPLGEPVDQTPPWHAADLLMVAFAVLCLVGFVSGVFQ